LASERELRFTVVGNIDERSLRRTETRLQRFGKNLKGTTGVAGIGGKGAGLLGLGSGNALAAGAAASALALRSVINASKEAEVVLGQTSVAVQNAGLSWKANAADIDAAATRISKTSSFDDEAVLQSFQVFVRGQKDVGKSLELAGLAADVARGRYTDLESATQLVNKAAMGQIGALRRAGIQIDKTATSTEALEALTAAYGGSAKRYSESAAGSMDRLKVSVENLEESLGAGLLPVLTEVVDVLDQGVSSATLFADALKTIGINSDDVKGALVAAVAAIPGLNVTVGAIKGIAALRGGGGDDASGVLGSPSAASNRKGRGGTRPGPQETATTKVATGAKFTREQTLLLQQERARLNNYLSDDLKVAKAIVELRERQLRNAKPKERYAAEQALIASQQDLYSVQTDIANNAAAQTKKNTGVLKNAGKKTADALKNQARAFKDQADAIKSAVLDTFDIKSQKIDNSRALEDAKKALAQARQLGGPESIRLAQRELVDAQRAIERQKIEQTSFRVTAGPAGPMNALQVGNVVINVSGAGDPDAVAQKVLAVLRRKSKQTAGTTSGRNPNPMQR
jgi:hypothetical protein